MRACVLCAPCVCTHVRLRALCGVHLCVHMLACMCACVCVCAHVHMCGTCTCASPQPQPPSPLPPLAQVAAIAAECHARWKQLEALLADFSKKERQTSSLLERR